VNIRSTVLVRSSVFAGLGGVHNERRIAIVGVDICRGSGSEGWNDTNAHGAKVADGGWRSGHDCDAGQGPGVFRAVRDLLPAGQPRLLSQWRWVKPG
jgi:hypothetical protein